MKPCKLSQSRISRRLLTQFISHGLSDKRAKLYLVKEAKIIDSCQMNSGQNLLFTSSQSFDYQKEQTLHVNQNNPHIVIFNI